MKQKLFTFLLVLIASVGIASAQSGTCGDNLTWELNTETGDLTISGTGAMADHTSASNVPWYDFKKAIQSVIITDGVTSIGYETFSYCSSLTSVTIPNSVTSIGYNAFSGCESLTSVAFEGLTPPTIGMYVFNNTNNCPIYVPYGTKDAYVAALNVNNTIDASRVIEK